jgi:putative NADH-flavin reductase
MRLAIFGGTGRVGRRLLQYATAGGYRARALVRDPARGRELPDGVELVSGDVTDPAAVLEGLQGCQAVLSALGGAGLANPGTTLSQGMRTIVAAMHRQGIRRVLAVAGSGILDDPRGGLRSEAPGFPAVYQAITAEHRGTWDALQASDLDWTLVCCPDLVDGARTDHYRVSANQLPQGGSSISVEDTAGFMIGQLGDPAGLRGRVGIAY